MSRRAEYAFDEGFLASVLDDMGVGLWVWRVDRGTIAVDRRWKEIAGYGPDEAGPETLDDWLSLAHPSDRAAMGRVVERVTAGEAGRFEVEYRVQHRKGYYVWVVARGSVSARDASGRPLRVVGSHADVTLRKQVEELARRENETLRAIFDASIDGLFLANAEGNLVDCNEAFLALTGYGRDRAIALNVADLNPDIDSAARLAEAKAKGKSRFQTRVLRADGDGLDAEVGVTFLDQGGGLFVCSCRDMSERVRYENRLKELSIKDPLTGIYNRRHAMDRLNELIAKCLRGGGPVSVALFDLDHFKKLNDTYGHLVGDRAIIHFTGILRDCVREYDVVARYGGEEFLAILDGADGATAASVAQRVLDTLRRTPIEVLREPLTASAGVASSEEFAADALSDAAFLDLADGRLYAAKAAGRDRVVRTGVKGG